MHHALQTPEIVSMIIGHATAHTRTKFNHLNNIELEGNRKQAFILAQVCSQFSAPALDVLWRFLSSFTPFFCTFPDDLWTISTSVREQGFDGKDVAIREYALNRPLRSTDLQRFDFYASRVRTLNLLDHRRRLLRQISNFEQYTFPVEVLHELVRQRSLLVPRLTELRLFYINREVLDDEALRSILPSTIRTLCLYPCEEDTITGSGSCGLNVIAQRCSNITNLYLPCPSRSVATRLVDNAAIQSLLHAENLRHLGTSWSGYGEFFYVSAALMQMRTSTVTSLELGLTCDSDEDVAMMLAGQDFFPNLQFLRIKTVELSLAICLIDAFGPKHLKQLYIENCDAEGAEADLPKLLAAICTSFDHNALTHLHITCDILQDEDYEDDLVSPPGKSVGCVESLAVFQNLESLVINLHYDFHLLNDAQLVKLSTSMPRLKVLDIEGCETTTNVSTDGMFAALNNLPHLQFLGLRFALDRPAAKTASLPTFSRIHTLATRGAPVTDVTATAEIILHVFPYLKWIIMGYKWDDDGHKQWSDIYMSVYEANFKYPMVEYSYDAPDYPTESTDWPMLDYR